MKTLRTQYMVAIGFLAIFAGAAAVSAQPASLVLDGPLQFADGSLQHSATSGLAYVEDTGQKRCWDDTGSEIACSGTGQDGERQAGLDWPGPRFADNLDGTITDQLTGLVWLRDAGCLGTLSWEDALTTANELLSGFCALTDGSQATDWRLPNIKELQSLIDFSQTLPALPAGHPFVDVRQSFYWTSTSAAEAPANAWGVGLYFGGSDNGSKSGSFFVWPVRDPTPVAPSCGN